MHGTLWRRADAGRLVLALPLVLLSLPWFAADLGFFLNGVPGLGSVFQTGEYRQRIAGLPPFPPAVHHGHHHGLNGLLLVLSALLLSRTLRLMQTRALRDLLATYLALIFCYGVGNIANDFWIEQISNVLEPRATIACGIIVLGAAALWVLARPL